MQYVYSVKLYIYDTFDGDKNIIETTVIAHNQDEVRDIIKSQYSDYKIVKIEAITEIE